MSHRCGEWTRIEIQAFGEWGERVHRPLMRRSAAGDNRTGRTTSVESRMGPLVKIANEETGRARGGHV
jgi:hypothetical protein